MRQHRPDGFDPAFRVVDHSLQRHIVPSELPAAAQLQPLWSRSLRDRTAVTVVWTMEILQHNTVVLKLLDLGDIDA